MFSQTAEYALRAMVCLALRPEGRVAAGLLAEETKVPSDYLAKVLQLLARARLVAGRRGVGGGYVLAREASQIRLVDVLDAVEKGRPAQVCAAPAGAGAAMHCGLHRAMGEATQSLRRVLENVTLADIASGGQPPLCTMPATAG